jgi:MFS family permease
VSASSYRSVLGRPRFLQLWGAQFLGQISQNVANFALIVLVNVQTGSTLAGGFLVILFSIPAIVLGPLPGMLVDRVGRWWVLWLANLLRTLLGLGVGLALAFIYGGATHGANSGELVALLYLFSLSLSLSTRFYMPAEATAIPSLVGLRGLAYGLALFGITFVVAEALGLIVLGPLLHLAFGWPALFYACAGGFGLATLLSLLLSPRQLGVAHYGEGETPDLAESEQDAALLATLEVQSERQTLWQQLKAGWQPIAHDSQVFVAVVRLSLSGVVIALVSELAPNFVVQVLRRPAEDISLVLAPAGAALIIGAVLAPRLASKLGQLRVAGLGVNGVALAVLLLALNRPLGDFVHLPDGLIVALAVAEASLLGFALNLISIPCQAIMQERVLPRLRGSIVAFQQAVFNLAAVPILVVIGLLADDLGIPYALLAVAIIVLLAARLHVREKPGSTVHPDQLAPVIESPDRLPL